jgi:glycosyltransferase involved in cell wall biosynthesis
MKIVYVDYDFATLAGHTGTRTFLFARELVRRGHEVRVIASDRRLGMPMPKRFHRFEEEGVGVDVLHVGLGRRRTWLGWLWAHFALMARCWFRLLRCEKPDVLIAVSPPLPVVLPVVVACRLRGVPYVLETRRLIPEVLVGTGRMRSPVLIGILSWLANFGTRRARRIVALTDGMARHIAADTKVSDRVVMIPHCCDLELFSDGDGRRIREANGWENKFVCLHLGSMTRFNGLEDIPRTADILREDEQFVFWMIGDGDERDSFEQNIRDRELTNVVIWDPQPRSNLPDILAAADLCLATIWPYPVLEQSGGQRLFDYLAAGRPILLNYGGWQRDLLEKNNAGLGSGLGKHEDFWRQICELCDDRKRRESMAGNARHLAETHFGLSRWTEVLEKELQAVIRAKSSTD